MVFKRPLGSQIVTFKTFAKLLLLSLFAYFFITTTSSILYTVNLNVRRMTRNLYLHIINYPVHFKPDFYTLKSKKQKVVALTNAKAEF